MTATKGMNILVIMADQLNGFSLGCYGNPVVKTPTFDKLAAEGVLFENAYVNSPLCAPARFTMMAGQHASRIKAYDNAAYYPSNVPTFAHYLRAMGYQTCLSGKMHFIGADQMHGFEERVTTDIYPADFGWVPDWESEERIDWWYHNMMSVKQAGVAEATNQLDFDDEVAFQARRKLYDYARAQSSGVDQRPFFLLASFTHPHDPYATRQKYWDMYDNAEIDLPRVPAMDYADMDPHSQRLHQVSDIGAVDITEQDIRNARRAYYGNITYVDEQAASLLKVLDETGMRDNTIVVVISDHGDMLGERGLWYKMSFFEASCRIPMIVSAPKLFGSKRVTNAVSQMDFLPTLMDLAELSGSEEKPEVVEPLDGRSLLPLLEGAAIDDPDEVIGEYMGEGAIAPVLMIRRGKYKYIHCDADPVQLYDLEADPNELTNLAEDPAHSERKAAFEKEVYERWQPEELHWQVLQDQKKRRLLYNALKTGRFQPWDYQPGRDATQQYMRNHLDLNDLERTSRFPAPKA
ncbi:choline-sulfatase [Aestuariispira insulae]|uniref:Choline-sulfatase n=1 Tax=Aestuariispira insulae TaxID=1461337 RepID=A0A3D9HG89_9PROT|nr:choline-sulfatase [Aestuariispira insulae]RED48006.1 choline-sulfatase [Aestuariispira insulae]